MIRACWKGDLIIMWHLNSIDLAWENVKNVLKRRSEDWQQDTAIYFKVTALNLAHAGSLSYLPNVLMADMNWAVASVLLLVDWCVTITNSTVTIGTLWANSPPTECKPLEVKSVCLFFISPGGRISVWLFAISAQEVPICAWLQYLYACIYTVKIFRCD